MQHLEITRNLQSFETTRQLLNILSVFMQPHLTVKINCSNYVIQTPSTNQTKPNYQPDNPG